MFDIEQAIRDIDLPDIVPRGINELVGTIDIYAHDFDRMYIVDQLNNKTTKAIQRNGKIEIVTLFTLREEYEKSGNSLYEKDIFPLSWTDNQINSYMRDNQTKRWTNSFKTS